MKDKFRLVLSKIQDCIEMQNGATDSQLKDIWNGLSDAITESESHAQTRYQTMSFMPNREILRIFTSSNSILFNGSHEEGYKMHGKAFFTPCEISELEGDIFLVTECNGGNTYKLFPSGIERVEYR